MSLINDALKQARAAQVGTPATAANGPELRPVENVSRFNFIFIAGPLAVVFVAIAGWLMLSSFETGRRGPVPATAEGTLTLEVAARSPAAAPPPLALHDGAGPRAAAGALIPATPDSSTPLQSNGPDPTPPAVPPIAGPAADTTGAPPAAPKPDETAAATIKTNAAVVAAPGPPEFPSLKLQGIIFSLSKPSVVINNKSLYVGEKIHQAVVVAIGRESATVEWNGQRKVLTLP